MKKTLLFLAISLAVNLASAQYYLNEIFVNPSGSDSPFEYFEIRGPINGVFPAGTYIVQVDGDNASSSDNPGDLDNFDSGVASIDLSGLTLGANGILVIATTGHDYTIDAAATLVLDVTDGDVEGQSHSFLLIGAPTAPSGSDDIDVNDDGTPDGVYLTWTIYDSVAFIDDDSTSGEYSYAQISYVEAAAVTGLNSLPGSTIVSTPTQFDYAARVFNSTGYAQTNDINTSDWIAGDVISRNATRVDWQYSSTAANSMPIGFAGTIMETHIGAPNPGPTASINDFTFSNLSVYPNPATTSLSVVSNGPEQITAVEVYNVLGKRVASHNDWNSDSIDVSNLNTGVYFLRVYNNDSNATQKIIIE